MENYEKKYKEALERAKCYKGLKAEMETIFPELAESDDWKYNGLMDNECIELCDALNNLPDLQTFESCCGHLKKRYSIWFFCDNIDTISRLGRCTERNYSDGKWEIIVDSTDTHPTGVFWLRSKEPFNTYDEMNDSIKELIDSISHWFKQEFDSYFQGNAGSKDERIRKHLIKHFGNKIKENWNGIPVDDIVAWLEKQGEQKSIELNEDEKIRKEIIFFFEQEIPQCSIEEHKEYMRKWISWLEKQDKNNMGISEATKKKLEDNLNRALEKETPESWNEFLGEQGKQKPAEWSEEDKRHIQSIISTIEICKAEYPNATTTVNAYNSDIDWLKSLNPQSHWKPTKEQLETLKYALGNGGTYNKEALEQLLEQLKSL